MACGPLLRRADSASPAGPFFRLPVQMVGGLEPVFYRVVDVGARADRDTVGDALALSQAAGVHAPARGWRVPQGEAQVNAGARAGLDLGENVVAVKRNDGLAGASLDVLT